MKIEMNAAQLEQTQLILREVLGFHSPADVLLSRFFRDNKKIGAKDRHAIAEMMFACLRHYERLEAYIAPDSVTARRLILLVLLKVWHKNIKEIPGLSSKETDWLATVKARSPVLNLSQQASLPAWIIDHMAVNPEFVIALGQSMAMPAPLDLRVNTIKSKRQPVLDKLATIFDVTATPYSPVGLRLKEKVPINKHSLYDAGVIEVQDEGSQLLSMLLDAKRGDMVVDFCAGAGGKTLHIGAMMASTGRLYAFDVSEKRLSNLKPRLARSGLSNVQPYLLSSEFDQKLKRLAAKFDKVLVDAPCSGLGTLRRNPDLKYRQSPESVQALNEKQRSILAAAAKLVRLKGRLVYATCSLLESENEAIVHHFLANNPAFQLIPMNSVLAELKIPITMDGNFLKLFPHIHQTDGFFAAVLQKTTEE